MSSRFSRSPDPRNDLFSSYNRSASPSKSKAQKAKLSPYGYSAPDTFSAYPGSSSGNSSGANGTNYPYGGRSSPAPNSGSDHAFRAATPNSRGQFSSAVLDELESQNETQVGVLTGKVRMLKELTVAIGGEIRDSTALAETMNEGFENSRLRIKGTMGRMLRMAERTGVGWRVWVGFFLVVGVLFWYVWLF